MVKINKICVLRANGTYIFHLKNWDIEQQYLQKEANQHGIHAQSMLGDLDTKFWIGCIDTFSGQHYFPFI